jgi:hypothetical protein
MNKILTVLIPSRNRFELLQRTLQSIEKVQLDDVCLNVVISDNSDTPYQSIVSTLPLRIIRPPSRLSMSQHWDWMINQVKSDYYCILTDRSLLFPENFTQALKTLRSENTGLISYSFAGYSDHYFPYFVGGLGYSNTSNLLTSVSIMEDARKSHYWAAFPRALNCIFSTGVVSTLKDKFGCVFGGVAPDVNFAFKYLSLFDNFIYLDKPVFLSIGINHSNGRAMLKGQNTELSTWVLRESPWQINKIEPLPSIADVPFPINYTSHEMADVCGLDGFSFVDFYDRIEKEKITSKILSNKNISSFAKKIARPFTAVKSYELAMTLASTCFNTSRLKKKFIFE